MTLENCNLMVFIRVCTIRISQIIIIINFQKYCTHVIVMCRYL